jgi:hypothetical protein
LAGWYFIPVEQKRDAIHVCISGGSFFHTHDLPHDTISRGLENDCWGMVRVGKVENVHIHIYYMYYKPSHVLIHLSFSGFGHVLCLGTGGYNQRGKFMFLVG